MSELKEQVARYFRWSTDDVTLTAQNAPFSYRRYWIPKKSGGRREIMHPAKKTKALQYALMSLYLENLPVSKCAMAYRTGLSGPLRKNAMKHASFAYSVRLDMTDFFPSLIPPDLFAAWQDSALDEMGPGDQEFLENALFAKRHGQNSFLAIGAPASPMISNAVMFKLDHKWDTYARGREACYTRYADDIVYSSNQKGECTEFVRYVEELLKSTPSPSLKLNKKKTRYLSRGGRRAVTGLIITPTGKVSIGRKRKRHVRSMLFELSRGELNTELHQQLRGLLGFILDVEPSCFNRLSVKYGAAVMKDALNP